MRSSIGYFLFTIGVGQSLVWHWMSGRYPVFENTTIHAHCKPYINYILFKLTPDNFQAAGVEVV